MKFEECLFPNEWESSRDAPYTDGGEGTPSDAALGALLEDAEPSDDDAERRVRRLGSRLQRLDALNVGGMLAAATEGGGAGAALAARLDAALAAAGALAARRARLDAPAPAAPHARSDAARADANARRLLAELAALDAWLDAPALCGAAPDALGEAALGSAAGRARALEAAQALSAALRAERRAPPALRRLAAVRDRLRRLARAKDQLAGALARHLNNALIHLGNERAGDAAPGPGTAPAPGPGLAPAPGPQLAPHHAELLPLAPFMRWLKLMDERAFQALAKVYVSTWARVHERAVRGACDAARDAPAGPPGADTLTDRLDAVLALVEGLCDAEQDFCTHFFFLDVDLTDEGAGAEDAGAAGGGAGAARAGAESRRAMAELFPALDAELLALLAHLDKHDPHGAMRALACVGRRVLAARAGEARWARAALAGAAVAAKRAADRAVAARLAALPDAVRQAARKPKCGVLSFIPELEALGAACERAFAGSGRRADLERWYLALADGMMDAVQRADHPRTPRAVLHMENYHALHGAVSALRAGALERVRRELRACYADALRSYVTQYFGRPLEKLTLFFEGVAEAVAQGVREDEVCYRAAFSKHELRRVLQLYPAAEVRKSLHRLYRTVEKHLSEEGGLLQVVWRAMQEEFIAQHVALQARIAACYPAAGLALPLTTQHILDAFSDIAREH